ncbi:hypothetical protein F5Y17DRAFT_220471 [Xylariaceae sp. FL0594]|nr:hypothetical protein F5Y17DRAFT_220471 [Xylariaceae sp. FL0594]
MGYMNHHRDVTSYLPAPLNMKIHTYFVGMHACIFISCYCWFSVAFLFLLLVFLPCCQLYLSHSYPVPPFLVLYPCPLLFDYSSNPLVNDRGSKKGGRIGRMLLLCYVMFVLFRLGLSSKPTAKEKTNCFTHTPYPFPMPLPYPDIFSDLHLHPSCAWPTNRRPHT